MKAWAQPSGAQAALPSCCGQSLPAESGAFCYRRPSRAAAALNLRAAPCLISGAQALSSTHPALQFSPLCGGHGGVGVDKSPLLPPLSHSQCRSVPTECRAQLSVFFSSSSKMGDTQSGVAGPMSQQRCPEATPQLPSLL